jgi:hypothetical protein
MRRRKYDFATITEFPELASELPVLLFDLGTVSQMRCELTDSFVSLTIRLNRPARVWHIPGTRPKGRSRSIRTRDGAWARDCRSASMNCR